ncbi:MAG: glycosyltransferase [Candidatus Methanoperedens sp.]|nr:glycosyltransferase [Candidatus Methanoperedens sp.]
MKQKKKISIVILTKNNGKTIDKVLQQIIVQQINNDFEVIVVDSGSNDDTLEILSKYDIRLYTIPPADFGHARTRNLASGYADGDYLVYLSADAIPAHEKWLENLVCKLDDIKTAATFGRQIPYQDTPPMERFFIQNNYPSTVNKTYSNNGFKMNAFFSNVNSAIKRSVWEKINFNEKLIISEDHDWAKRSLDLGYNISYIPDACVFHSHKYGLLQVFKRYFDSGVSFSQMGLKPGVIRNGLGYFIDELRYVGNESVIKIPHAIVYDLSKFIGFQLGVNQRWLPKFIKVHLSMHSYFWKN